MKTKKIATFISQWLADQKGFSVEDINFDENIFQTGLIDSLGMFRLLFEIEKEFNLELNQNELFNNAQPTIHSLAFQVALQINPIEKCAN